MSRAGESARPFIPPFTPLVEAILVAVEDGSWHSIHDLFSTVGWRVPPGHALRRRHADRINSFRRYHRLRGHEPTREEIEAHREAATSTDDDVYRGRRDLIMEKVNDLGRRGYIEIERESKRLCITMEGKRRLDLTRRG